jgi:hypothetical protein
VDVDISLIAVFAATLFLGDGADRDFVFLDVIADEALRWPLYGVVLILEM